MTRRGGGGQALVVETTRLLIVSFPKNFHGFIYNFKWPRDGVRLRQSYYGIHGASRWTLNFKPQIELATDGIIQEELISIPQV